MHKNTNDTAVLVFSRSAEADGKEKNLIPHELKNVQSLKWLRNETISKVKQSGLPSFLIDVQQGTTFGDRLANAFSQVFEQGYQYVIAIGSDCPELTVGDLKEATRVVKDTGSAIGPDQRNGAYLIAINRNQFDRTTFAQLPWQTRETFAELTKYLINPSILRSKQDLNDFSDLKAIIEHSSRRIRRALLVFLDALFVDFSYAHCLQPANFDSSLTHRGPPLH